MKKRYLGQTDCELSIIGFGGILVRDTTPDEADRYVGEAIDLGVNYFDVAPLYGNAQERLGPALTPYRDQSFLACKTLMRDANGARSDLEDSLRKLKTDHFDLYQFHGIQTPEEVQEICAPGGALETAIQARDQGLIRHIGFSTHSDEIALSMLNEFPFDSVLFPINIFCWNEGNIGPRLMEKIEQTGTGLLAIKALTKRPLQENEEKKWKKAWYVPIDTLEEAVPALAFTLSKPVTAAIPPGHIELFRLACDALETLGESPWKVDESCATGEPLFSAG